MFFNVIGKQQSSGDTHGVEGANATDHGSSTGEAGANATDRGSSTGGVNGSGTIIMNA